MESSLEPTVDLVANISAPPSAGAATTADPQTAGAPSDTSTGRRSRVALLFGGRSGEHGISCVTAAGVLQAIDREAYEVVPIGITAEGRWVLVGAAELARWQIRGRELPQVRAGDGPEVRLTLTAGTRELFTVVEGAAGASLGRIDVFFPLLHGPYGEDGTVQGLLDLAGVPYVGSGVLASAVGMDKHVMKVILAAEEIPIGDHLLVTERRWNRERDEVYADIEELGWPVFVKPARAGSSLGISKVKGPADLESAIDLAHRHDRKVVVEAMIEGREIECAVLDSHSGPAVTSLPGEIRVRGGHEFYDFEAKYLDGDRGAELICPADLPDDTVRRVRELAARTFEVLGCEGLARVDFFVQADGAVIVNEINTMPGFTPISMYPRMWERTGLSYSALVDRLITLALSRPVGLR